MTWAAATAEARQGCGEDRIATVTRPGLIRVVVADGAGGVSGGAKAAETICSELASYVEGTPWDTWLTSIDRRMAASAKSGLAAAVVVEIGTDGSVAGASAGDCEAWVLGDREQALTAHQNHKPFIGSGQAAPVPFAWHLSSSTLVIGTDGLWKYANRSRIREMAAIQPLEIATAKLIDAVRLKSGSLQDDVAVFVYATEEK